jgi:integrase
MKRKKKSPSPITSSSDDKDGEMKKADQPPNLSPFQVTGGLMDKIDPYNHKDRWETWKIKNSKGIIGLPKLSSDLILDFLSDMEIGRNVNPQSKQGPRSPIRLNSVSYHLLFVAQRFKKPINRITEKEILAFFQDLRTGSIKRKDGKNYIDSESIIKDFKAFWSWMIRTRKTKRNITLYLSRGKGYKPPWVYLTEDQFKQLIAGYPSHLKPLILFMYDSGMRVTEANSIRVRNFENDFSKLDIPQEVSKTFGRKISLTFSREPIKRFIQKNKLGPDDQIFIISPHALNKNLKKTAARIFGDAISPAREKYANFSLYDIRHNAACYWANRYPTIRGLMYRLGWKKEEQASYYHEFLGFKDEIKPNFENNSMSTQKIDLNSEKNQTKFPKKEAGLEIDQLKILNEKMDILITIFQKVFNDKKFKEFTKSKLQE